MKEFKGYEVSEDGHIYSNTNWRGYGRRQMIETTNEHGYLTVSLTHDGKKKKHIIHNVVAFLFHGAKPIGKQVRHLDGNKNNNHKNNLKYGTAKENAEDRFLHGKTAIGSKVGTSKLTESQVSQIRERHIGYGSGRKLSKEFNVSGATISYIVNNKFWNNGN